MRATSRVDASCTWELWLKADGHFRQEWTTCAGGDYAPQVLVVTEVSVLQIPSAFQKLALIG